ncbi:ParB N-terminal domain-containing protein [Collimonas fungivorans]|uniref:ParB N-terminal domain-containing protein n=1 Tax=Collimonas fungivorans TaxID=158899 RepID=UPI0007781E93|nr:ParB N-terminal domain-containing protein [Collimonas fungivorans]
MEYTVSIVPISGLKQSEEVDNNNVTSLIEAIAKDDYWTTPISVENGTGLLMDGNHRLQAALALNLHSIPCIKLSYSDKRVNVRYWDSSDLVDVESIRQSIQRGKLLPYKTTKHVFSPPLPFVSIPLQLLRVKF